MAKKILAVSDIHNDKGLIKRIKEILEKERPDITILAGDILWFGEGEGIISYLKNYSKYLIVIPGNHEDPSIVEIWERMYNIINLHNRVLEINDVVIGGFGGGNVPFFIISEEDVKKYLNNLKDAFLDKRKFRILITHVHPENTISSKFGTGSLNLYKFIKYYQPDIVIHGHMHEAGGTVDTIDRTIILNVARSPKIIEINEKSKEIRIRDVNDSNNS